MADGMTELPRLRRLVACERCGAVYCYDIARIDDRESGPLVFCPPCFTNTGKKSRRFIPIELPDF